MAVIDNIPADLVEAFRKGMVIPAVPLALAAERRFDERRQRALLCYYVDAGAGGIAVGVHSTQFAIRRPGIDLLEPVLALTSEAVDEWAARRGRRVLKIAGVCGATEQALREAELAHRLGYHAALLSLAGLPAGDVAALLAHCREVSRILPLVGFYLQPAVGGSVLPYAFWRGFVEIENVLGIKIAPFNRYQTLDVVRAAADAGRTDAVALYTGNDDAIVYDLITPYEIDTPAGPRTVRIAGGLLGHWAVWTRRAVELLEEIHTLRAGAAPVPARLLTRAAQITDCNAAFFDAANGFAGCIPGIHEVLRRQGLFAGRWCLDPCEELSPGQVEEIERVYRAYPELNDDVFVREHLDDWMA